MNRISAAITPPSRSTTSRSTTSKYSCNLDRSCRPSGCPNSLTNCLQVHLRVIWSQSPNASQNLLDLGLQVHLWVQHNPRLNLHLHTSSITASKCTSEFNLIAASMCISELLDVGLQMHLQTHSIMACKWLSEFNLISASKCISKLALSRPPSASLSYTISASKCISKLARSQPPSASLSLLNQCLQVLLWLRASTARSHGSRCIYRKLDR